VYSIVYVSTSLVPAGQEIGSIVSVSSARNAAAGVTGALLHSGARFAQVLEGKQPAVSEIMASIMRDRRHRDLVVIAQGPIAGRRFPSWSLVYQGRSTFASATVERALAERDRGDGNALGNLTRLLWEFARPR
jgi:hypothetical protein